MHADDGCDCDCDCVGDGSSIDTRQQLRMDDDGRVVDRWLEMVVVGCKGMQRCRKIVVVVAVLVVPVPVHRLLRHRFQRSIRRGCGVVANCSWLCCCWVNGLCVLCCVGLGWVCRL